MERFFIQNLPKQKKTTSIEMASFVIGLYGLVRKVKKIVLGYRLQR